MRNTLQRFWIQLTADKRRAGVLGAVLLVGILLWARIIIISNPPQRAIADDAAGSANDGQATMQDAAGDAASGNADHPPEQIVLPQGLSRDPFRISPKHFPKPTPPPEESKEVVELESSRADDEQRVYARRTAYLRGLAGTLTLEAVMKGGLAVINGRTLKVGDHVPAAKDELVRFKLVETGTRWVIVEAEGRSFQLKMTSGLETDG